MNPKTWSTQEGEEDVNQGRGKAIRRESLPGCGRRGLPGVCRRDSGPCSAAGPSPVVFVRWDYSESREERTCLTFRTIHVPCRHQYRDGGNHYYDTTLGTTPPVPGSRSPVSSPVDRKSNSHFPYHSSPAVPFGRPPCQSGTKSLSSCLLLLPLSPLPRPLSGPSLGSFQVSVLLFGPDLKLTQGCRTVGR